MMETAESRPWSDLQPELLGLVLRRLPSIADRVRLRAVCHPWRSNSLLQSIPLPFPWITLPDGTFLNIPGGEIHHMPVPVGACCCGSIDDWLFLMSSDVSYKLVVPSPLDSAPDSLVAALIMDDDNCATLCISQPPIATDLFRDDKVPALQIEDVAFFDGKLYALCGFGKLCIVELGNDLCIASTECIIHSLHELGGIPKSLPKVDNRGYTVGVYLVECGGRLLIVKRWFESIHGPVSDYVLGYDHTVAFEVFEADLSTNPGRWRRISKLGGHALFLGQHASKSLPATECSGYREDCIYFMADYLGLPCSVNPLLDSGVYNMRNGKITPLMVQTAAAPPERAGQWRPAWFFPPEAV
ncbi:hypothetical protein QYE76_027877 [Lolium multiflorum]|uniref:KIB1-4 beta-propeller domain-containing protein n=1 Tax=Lolium multiflorum TaxID=4521 RepID=A0AAD8VFB4_LOLMU|nr:hypothetical protein QYE76_027877 [Lolium multiflorum]